MSTQIYRLSIYLCKTKHLSVKKYDNQFAMNPQAFNLLCKKCTAQVEYKKDVDTFSVSLRNVSLAFRQVFLTSPREFRFHLHPKSQGKITGKFKKVSSLFLISKLRLNIPCFYP